MDEDGGARRDRRGRRVSEAATDDGVRGDFEAFVRQHWSALMSIGMAVSGSRAEAEDLVQTALAGAYPRWRRIRREQALGYLRRSILNANISRWRRNRGSEVMLIEAAETHSDARSATDDVDERESVLPLLRALPNGQRAVLVLRYLCDLPDAEIAATLRISTATVRSQASRGLATLRAVHRPNLIREVS
jgi:RNA polymerase sigma-70 factor (sigma-E family)